MVALLKQSAECQRLGEIVGMASTATHSKPFRRNTEAKNHLNEKEQDNPAAHINGDIAEPSEISRKRTEDLTVREVWYS